MEIINNHIFCKLAQNENSHSNNEYQAKSLFFARNFSLTPVNQNIKKENSLISNNNKLKKKMNPQQCTIKLPTVNEEYLMPLAELKRKYEKIAKTCNLRKCTVKLNRIKIMWKK